MDLIINDIYVDECLQERSRILALYGASGSGKSVFAAQKTLYRTVTELNCRSLCIRKTKEDIKYSMFDLLVSQIENAKVRGQFKITQSPLHITNLTTGSDIIFAGIREDASRLKSIFNVSNVWFEEPTEAELSDFLEIQRRLRGKTDNYKQVLLTFNPIDKDHWLKTHVCEPDWEELVYTTPHWTWHYDSRVKLDEEEEDIILRTKVVRTNYTHNKFLSKEDIANYKRQAEHDEMAYRVYFLAEWGTIRTGQEYFPLFVPSKHLGVVEYDPELPLHISFDFNTMPYMTLLIIQIGETEDGNPQVRVVDEICARHPDNNTKGLCRRFMKTKYADHTGGLYYYGDYSSKSGNTMADEQFKHDYDRIDFELATVIHNFSDRVIPNQPVMARRNFVNDQLGGDIGIGLIIDEKNCPELTKDFMFLKEAPDGRKHKEHATDAITGKRYEKIGHTSDAYEYFVTSAFNDIFRDLHLRMRG